MVRMGVARQGTVWCDAAGVARCVTACCGEFSYGMARQARQARWGKSWCGEVWRGLSGIGLAGKVRLGRASYGWVRRGLAGSDNIANKICNREIPK